MERRLLVGYRQVFERRARVAAREIPAREFRMRSRVARSRFDDRRQRRFGARTIPLSAGQVEPATVICLKTRPVVGVQPFARERLRAEQFAD